MATETSTARARVALNGEGRGSSAGVPDPL